jgi:hypothetical protein
MALRCGHDAPMIVARATGLPIVLFLAIGAGCARTGDAGPGADSGSAPRAAEAALPEASSSSEPIEAGEGADAGVSRRSTQPRREGWTYDPGFTIGGEPPLPEIPPGTLTGVAIEKVVSSHKTEVRRECWERRPHDAGPMARAQVDVKINADGKVTSALATGNDAGLNACLEALISRWVFPGGPGEVTIPFYFAVPAPGPAARGFVGTSSD